MGNKLGIEFFKALSSLKNLEEIYCNYNEIIDKKAQKEIFENLKNFKKMKILQLKGNEINKNLLKEYTKNITIDKFECYSENEEELEEEEEAEVKEKEKIDKLTEDIDKININK